MVLKNKQKICAPADTQNYKVNIIFCHERKPSTAESVPVQVPWISFTEFAGMQALYIYHLSQRCYI